MGLSKNNINNYENSHRQGGVLERVHDGAGGQGDGTARQARYKKGENWLTRLGDKKTRN